MENNWKEYELNRFGEGVTQNFTAVKKQVNELEKFLGVQPFTKYKHAAVSIQRKPNSVK
jgi:hypothetical protein